LHYIPGLQLLLDYGANPDAENDEGETPLNLVSRGYGPEQDCVGIARLLLERGVDVNARKKDKTTPLHSAAFEGNLEIARVLLDHGANADAENDECETPLNLVMRGGYDSQDSVDIARLLLECGVDVNARKKNKTTPLHSAASGGMLKTAEVLLDHGAIADAENDEGETPLNLVSRREYDLEFEEDEEYSVGIARLLLERGVDVNARKKNKTTPLHSAASQGRLKTAQVLLDHGANADAENDEGETPLNLVSQGGYGSQDGIDIARLLLERGVDVNARKKNKTTPLHSAAFNGCFEIAQVLLDHGANVDAEDDEGETPLSLVSRGGYDSKNQVRIARLLLERGVDVNARNKNKNTPLHSAAFGGGFKIARVLLDHGANADAENDEGETPLNLVSRGGYGDSQNRVRIARLLLERGVEVNARNENKTTPLHSAAFWGRPEIAQVLLFLKKTKYHLYSGTTGAPRSWCKCERGE